MGVFNARYLYISTSPRSPYRIQHYLKLLEEFEGRIWSPSTTQIEYYNRMVEKQEGDFEIGNSKNPAFSARDKVGRAPKAFGFVKLDPSIEITNAGKAFLNKNLETETLVRQLLKYQFPSPYYPEGNINKGYFNIKPFLELLRLIYTVGELTKNEFRAFGITMTDYHDFEDVIKKIHSYRKQETDSKKPKRKFYAEYIENYVHELYKDEFLKGNVGVRESKEKSSKNFVATKVRNIKDYADAYLRYLIGTELVLVNKQRKIVISSDKIEDVEFILKTVPREAIDYSLESYEDYLFNPVLPELVTDNYDVVKNKINAVNEELAKYTQLLLGEESIPMIDTSDDSLLGLKVQLQEKENLLKKYSVEEYSHKLKNLNQSEIDDIISTFEGIKAQEYFDNPLFLEWNCWRAITMINNGNIQGSFKTNTLGEPTGTAGGNMADIVGDYGDFNMICEVTMSGGKKQYEMENEPVMRHLGELRQKTRKETFGLFVAPKINDSVIAEFYYKHKIKTRIYGGTVEFIPFTIDEFAKFFMRAVSRPVKMNEKDIQQIHQESIRIAENAEDEIEWREKIVDYVLNI